MLVTKKVVGDIPIRQPHTIHAANQSMIFQLTFDISFFFFDAEAWSLLPFRFWPIFDFGGILELLFLSLKVILYNIEF